jgi:hypothetical protein
MLRTWVSTVRSDSTSRSAICRLDSARPTSPATSDSLGDSGLAARAAESMRATRASAVASGPGRSSRRNSAAAAAARARAAGWSPGSPRAVIARASPSLLSARNGRAPIRAFTSMASVYRRTASATRPVARARSPAIRCAEPPENTAPDPSAMQVITRPDSSRYTRSAVSVSSSSSAPTPIRVTSTAQRGPTSIAPGMCRNSSNVARARSRSPSSAWVSGPAARRRLP